MRALLTLALALAMALSPALPAAALSESGSHGWSRSALTLQAGPGRQYQVTGQIAGDVEIKVLRCQKLWCLVDGPGGHGWTALSQIDFGKGPYAIQADMIGGEMCFFEGTHFTGRSFCATTGQVFPDLALWGWDNRIQSVQVLEPTSAALCRDRGFQSYCERIVDSRPVLDQYLSRSLSSIRVY